MLTIWVHMVPGHLWGGEPLLERVCAVAVLVHGDKLLLWRGQRCEGVHHPLHPIRHHLCKEVRENGETITEMYFEVNSENRKAMRSITGEDMSVPT